MHLALMQSQADTGIGCKIAKFLDDLDHLHGFSGKIDGNQSALSGDKARVRTRWTQTS
jgi:hypothetical protein